MQILSIRLTEDYRLAIAVLAAGGSRRFGGTDKLTAPFRGKMLGLHVPDTLRAVDAAYRWVVTAGAEHPCEAGWRSAGFETLVNTDAASGMGTSVALAAQRAEANGADALMVCLADMPLVPAPHFAALAAMSREIGQNAILASSDVQASMPPACFGKDHFTKLANATGDVGARKLLKSARTIICPPELLIDIDTPETLAEIAQRQPD